MSNDNSNSNVPVQVAGLGVGRIVVAIAATLAFVSFFMPWINVLIIKQNLFDYAKMVSDKSMLGTVIWLGPIFLAFIHPAWIMLTKKEIARGDRIRGFVCAVIGFAWTFFFMQQTQSSAQQSGVPGNVIGSGVYLYLCACVVLIVGMVLYDRKQS